jgi:hypothetical protein
VTKSRGLWGNVRPPSDPRLHTYAWRQSRAYWKRVGKRQGLGCARCGVQLEWDRWYYPGTRKVIPNAFALGHKIGRDLGATLGYDPNYIDSVENTQPECAKCSARSGYLTQARKRGQTLPLRPKVPKDLTPKVKKQRTKAQDLLPKTEGPKTEGPSEYRDPRWR